MLPTFVCDQSAAMQSVLEPTNLAQTALRRRGMAARPGLVRQRSVICKASLSSAAPVKKPQHGLSSLPAPGISGIGLARWRTSPPARDVCVGMGPDEADGIGVGPYNKENSRKWQRTVFDVDRWEMHRSSTRYFRHLAGMVGSGLVRGLFRPLLYVVATSILVGLYETARAAHRLPAAFPGLGISKELFGLTSFALSLLLVFRTNASYERWDGARKTWGLVLNRSRDLVRQGLAWIPSSQSALRSALCRWVPAFSKALLCHLRKGEDLRKELDGILTPTEIEGVMRATHRPNYVLQVLAQIVQSAGLPTAATFRMEENLTNFEDCQGGCERILRTPIPLSYTRHTSRFLIIWLTMLPCALWGACGWGTIPLAVTVAFLLLGIEELGVSIEEPFSILPLEAISGTILANVRELQAMHDTSNATPMPQVGESAMPVAARDVVSAIVGGNGGNGGGGATKEGTSATAPNGAVLA